MLINNSSCYCKTGKGQIYCRLTVISNFNYADIPVKIVPGVFWKALPEAVIYEASIPLTYTGRGGPFQNMKDSSRWRKIIVKQPMTWNPQLAEWRRR